MTMLQHGLVPSTGGYRIERSLRFNSADSAYLNRTFSSGDRQKFTLNLWVKRSQSGARSIFTCGSSASSYVQFRFNTSDTLYILSENPTTVIDLETTQVFRDYSAWYMITLAVDTTQATSSNRVKLFVNGSQITAFSSATYPSQNTNLLVNSNIAHYLGALSFNTAQNLYDGYLAEINFIDGSQKAASDFGETDTDTGVWKPKAYSGSYGTNGFYLKFADNSGTTSTTLGKDSSGNGNNWTPNNFYVGPGSTNAEKAGIDSLVDTPTPYGTDTGAGGEVRGNYATLNPLNNGGLTLSNGNLDSSQTNVNAYYSCKSTIGMSSGKWYWEVLITNRSEQANSRFGIGMSNASELGNQFVGETSGGYSYFTDSASLTDGYIVNVSFTKITGAGFTTNDILMFAYDADNGKIWFGKNGTWLQSGAPASGTNPQFSSIPSNTYFPAISNYSAGGATAAASQNFGQRPFAYTAPSGFKALCTQNLPTPTIGATATSRANNYFDTIARTFTGASASITSLNFAPDFLWFKRRNAAASHSLYDKVRGSTKRLITNDTLAEITTGSGELTSFDSNGFTVGADTGSISINGANGDTGVVWCWRGNGAGSSNNAGSIQSTVSANTTAGFSVVTYTGNGTSGATVGHGLNATPRMMIFKQRSGTTSWPVYHTSLTSANYALFLNLTIAEDGPNAAYFNNTAPSSTVFTLGNLAGINGNGNTFVAYCFAPVAGYSAFGSYTGNGSADGPFIYTGFRPRYILVKPSSTTGSWLIHDTARNPYNTSVLELQADTSGAEYSTSGLGAGDRFDILSNGFKNRSSNSGANGSGTTYVYAAFAEVPQKFSLGR